MNRRNALQCLAAAATLPLLPGPAAVPADIPAGALRSAVRTMSVRGDHLMLVLYDGLQGEVAGFMWRRDEVAGKFSRELFERLHVDRAAALSELPQPVVYRLGGEHKYLNNEQWHKRAEDLRRVVEFHPAALPRPA